MGFLPPHNAKRPDVTCLSTMGDGIDAAVLISFARSSTPTTTTWRRRPSRPQTGRVRSVMRKARTSSGPKKRSCTYGVMRAALRGMNRSNESGSVADLKGDN
jgi:hypothetical protein